MPASIRNFKDASLLAVAAFLAASNLSCLLLSNKSIFYLLVLMIQLSCCKENANERNESLLSDCRMQLIFLQRYAFLLKDARNFGKIFESERDKKKKVYPACPISWARRIHLIILYYSERFD